MTSGPTFTIEGPTKLSPDCYMVRVKVSTDGEIYHRFFGTTERQAKARADIFVAEKRHAFLKSQAAVEARRIGRMTQALKAADDGPRGGDAA